MGQAHQSLPQRAADGQVENGLALAESPHGLEGGGVPIEANSGVRHQVREAFFWVFGCIVYARVFLCIIFLFLCFVCWGGRREFVKAEGKREVLLVLLSSCWDAVAFL